MTTLGNLRRLDSICDSFESNWSEASKDHICQLVQDVNRELQSELLKQLLWIDLDMRIDRGLATKASIYEHLRKPYESAFHSAHAEYINRRSAVDTFATMEPAESTSGQAITQSPLPPKYILGNYQIETCIGPQGAGLVYQAIDRSTQRRVAIKIPNPNLCEIGLFFKGVVAFSRLKHPNICQLYHVEQNADHPYIVYRHIEGSRLASLIRSEHLSIEASVKIVSKLCAVFQYVHSQGVICQNIKPSSILLDDVLEPVVADFEPAETIAFNEALKFNQEQMETIYCSAPEKLMGSTASKQSDIFSLGVLLYELIARRRPFHGDSIGQVTASVLRCEPSRPSTHNPEVPPELDLVCLKALMKDPTQRFQSMQEFRAALTPALRTTNNLKNTQSSKFIAIGLVIGLIAMTTIAIAAYWILHL